MEGHVPERVYGINSVADRRYYHFVALTGRGLGPATFWKKLNEIGEIERPDVAVPVDSPRFKLEHRKFRSKRVYARGAVTATLSEHGKGGPPFLYDVFAARIEFEDDPCLVIGFPFAALAVETIDRLTSNGSMKNSDFVGVDVSALLSEKNRPLKLFDGLSSMVVGVQYVVTDDKSLTSVRLGGDDPFQAEIYECFLRQKFERGLWVPDQCVLACERNGDTSLATRPGTSGGPLRSRVHIDKFGNFKFYMHVGCSNVTLMPYAIAQIHSVACLRKVSGNPLRRIEQDDAN
jgi:hypothetical protein